MFRKGDARVRMMYERRTIRTHHPTTTSVFTDECGEYALCAEMFRGVLRDASSADPVFGPM